MEELQGPGRYSRQERFTLFGKEGQSRLAGARAAVCGCGALGTVIAETLARAGVGFLRIIDRDLVEWTNLQRQILFDEEDARLGRPKAEAAVLKLRAINSEITLDPVAAELSAHNADSLLGDVDVIVDGCDNFETRFLINDYSHRHRKPWIYGGAIGSTGQSMSIVPGRTPCLRCLIESPPPPGSLPTCETAGIFAPTSMVIASIESMEAIKILSGNIEALTPGLLVVDLWTGRLKRMGLDRLKEKGTCPTCGEGDYPWLDGRIQPQSSSLCGRDAVQIIPSTATPIDWPQLSRELVRRYGGKESPFLVRFSVDSYEFSVFRDGRAIIRGINDVTVGRSLYARYIGH